MKRAISVLWKGFYIGILLLILALIFSPSDEARWRAFGIIIPIVSISFWSALILMVVDFFTKDK